MRIQRIKQVIGVVFLLLFVISAVYKIGQNSDNVAVYLLIGLILVILIWGITKLLSE